MREVIPALVLLSIMNGGAMAQTDPARRPPLVLSGMGQYDGYAYLRRRDEGLSEGRNEFRFVTEAEGQLSRTLAFEAALELRKDFVDDTRSRGFLDEAFLDASFDHWTLRLGRQNIAWGQSEFVSPANMFQRRDFTDFLDAEEEPIDAARFDLYRGDWTLEAVWVPVFQPDIFPLDLRNRWTLPSLTRRAPGPLPPGLEIVVDRSEEPPDDPRSSELGFRVTRRSGGTDWSASYRFGYDRTPSFVEQSTPIVDTSTGGAAVTLSPGYERIHVVGVDGKRFLGSVGVTGEVAYTITSDPRGTDARIDDPYLGVVVGVERTFGRIAAGTHDLFLHVQFLLDREIPRQGDANRELASSPVRHSYEYAATVRLEYRFSSFTRIASTSYVNLAEGDFVTQLELSWQPYAGWTWSAGADLMGGGEMTFFGLYRDNDRVRTALTVHLPGWEPFTREPSGSRR